jgi:hypothetical protein
MSAAFLLAARERPVYSELFCSDTALSATNLAAARAA